MAPTKTRTFGTRRQIAIGLALAMAIGWVLGWSPLRTAAERKWVHDCVVHHRDHGCGTTLQDGAAFCSAHPGAYVDRPAPVVHHLEAVPSCVTSYIYDHRSWAGTDGIVVLVLGWVAIAAVLVLTMRRRAVLG